MQTDIWINDFLKLNRIERKHIIKVWGYTWYIGHNNRIINKSPPFNSTLIKYQELFKHYWVSVSIEDIKLFFLNQYK